MLESPSNPLKTRIAA